MPTARLGALLAAAAVAWPTPSPADDFICRGHDPIWELVGGDHQAMLAPEKGGRHSFTGGASQLSAEGIVVWRGRAGPGEPDLVAILLKGACTDPMAGDVSGYLAILSGPQGAPTVGCCTYGKAAVTAALAPPPAAPAPSTAQAAPAPAPPALKSAEPGPPPAATRKPASGLRAGVSVRIAGPAKGTVNLRGAPSASAKVIGRLPGGRTVVVQQGSERNGEMWYRVRGRGVPANAWIRGDLLRGG